MREHLEAATREFDGLHIPATFVSRPAAFALFTDRLLGHNLFRQRIGRKSRRNCTAAKYYGTTALFLANNVSNNQSRTSLSMRFLGKSC